MHIVIFGASGLTGRLLTRRALDAGHSVVAVTRRPSDFPFTAPTLAIQGADVHDAAGVLAAVRGADTVLSTLSVPFARGPVSTFSAGTRNIAAAMNQTGARRLVVVSSTGAYPLSRTIPLAPRLAYSIIARTFVKGTYDDIRRMETVVRGSGLDWTIVRSSWLFDLDHTTNYIAGEVEPAGAVTARIDLADYLLRLATDETAAGKTAIISTTQHHPTLLQMIRREVSSQRTRREVPSRG